MQIVSDTEPQYPAQKDTDIEQFDGSGPLSEEGPPTSEAASDVPGASVSQPDPLIAPDDDGVWEDLPDSNFARPDERPPSTSNRSATLRRRKGKTIFIAQPTPTRRFPSKQPRNARLTEDASSPLVMNNERFRGAVRAGATSSWGYFTDVLGDAFWMLKKPLAVLMSMTMLAFLLIKLAVPFRTALQPICYIPGVSRSSFCAIPLELPKAPKWADYPRLMDVQSTTFEQLLDENVGGGQLNLEVKKAEMATTDLVTLVKFSQLKSKDLIARSLQDFVNDAKKTGRGLQKLGSKIGGAVDSIVAVNDHALHTIEAHLNQPKSLLSPLWSWRSDAATKELITLKFSDAMSFLAINMERVILEAQVSLGNLERLDQHLVTLHEILTRENISISTEKDELLAGLWVFLGRNNRKIRGLDDHLSLLRSIGGYRSRARAHVAAALQTLEGMSEDMEDLRERVSAPEIVGERIPIEVHMKSIQAGLDRLTEKRRNAQLREEEAMRRVLGSEE